MYYRQAGFVTDQQIWMVGVLVNYFLKSVMHFSHDDFMTALGKACTQTYKGVGKSLEKGDAMDDA